MTDQNSGRARAASEFSAIKQHTRNSQSHSKHHGDSFRPVEEGVAVKFTETLASAAPPESILQPPSTENTFTTPPPQSTLPDITLPPPQPIKESVSTQQDPQAASNVAKVSNDGLVTNQPLYPGPSLVPLPQTQPPQSSRPDPAPTRTYMYPPLTTGPPANAAPVYPGSTTCGYPSQGGYQQYTSQPPPQQGGYPNQTAYPPQSQYPVPSTVGYDTNIGFSFGGGVPSVQGSYPPPQPVYHQYPPSGQSTYGPGGPARPVPYDPYRQPSPASTQHPPRENPSHSSYGFNF